MAFSTIVPVGINAAAWEASNGSLLDCVLTPDDNRWITSGTSGSNSFVTRNPFGLSPSEIVYAVRVNIRARLVTEGSRTYDVGLRINTGVTYSGGTRVINSTEWATYEWVWYQNPETSTPWTVESIDQIIRVYFSDWFGTTPTQIDHITIQVDYGSENDKPLLVQSGFVTPTTEDAMKSAEITIQTGDLVVVKLSGKNWGTIDVLSSIPGMTWTQQGAYGSNPNGRVAVITGLGGIAGTHTLALLLSSAITPWGFSWEVWRNHGGVGAVNGLNSGNTALPTLALTTTEDGSAISWALSDSETPSAGTSPQLPIHHGPGQTIVTLDYPTDGVTAQFHATHLKVGPVGTYNVGRLAYPDNGHAFGGIEILAGSGAPETKSTTTELSLGLTSEGAVQKMASSGAVFAVDLDTGNGPRKAGNVEASLNFLSELELSNEKIGLTRILLEHVYQIDTSVRKVAASGAVFAIDLDTENGSKKSGISEVLLNSLLSLDTSNEKFGMTSVLLEYFSQIDTSIRKVGQTETTFASVFGLSSEAMKTASSTFDLDLNLLLNVEATKVASSTLDLAFKLLLSADTSGSSEHKTTAALIGLGLISEIVTGKKVLRDTTLTLALESYVDTNKRVMTDSAFSLELATQSTSEKVAFVTTDLSVLLAALATTYKTSGIEALIDVAFAISAAVVEPIDDVPQHRTLFIRADDRVMTIRFEDRTLTIGRT